MVKHSIKNVVLPFIICFIVALALYPNTIFKNVKYATNNIKLNYNFSSEIDNKEFEFKKSHYTPDLGKTIIGFKEALAFKESTGNYFTINSLGYLGKYQFGSSTLKTIGIYNNEHFINSPELQEKAFLVNAQRNKWVLRKYIKIYTGKTISGVKITESGILAAAHLAGPGNVKKFLRSSGKTNFGDAYGTSVKYYMSKFSGYDTSSVLAIKNARVKDNKLNLMSKIL